MISGWKASLLAGFVLMRLAACMSNGCTGVTNSKARLRVMTHLYFDPESGKYLSLDDNIFGLKTRLTGILNPRKFAEVFGFWVFLSEPPSTRADACVVGSWSSDRTAGVQEVGRELQGHLSRADIE